MSWSSVVRRAEPDRIASAVSGGVQSRRSGAQSEPWGFPQIHHDVASSDASSDRNRGSMDRELKNT